MKLTLVENSRDREFSLTSAVRNRFNVLKRRPDFDEMILPAKKVARTGAEREAKRRSGRTPEQVEKEREDHRVRKVAKRAGGLSQARKEDVRAGQRKNKDTEVFSGDALKTKEITEGNFIVEPLTGGRDGLGNLGDITCNFCGALK